MPQWRNCGFTGFFTACFILQGYLPALSQPFLVRWKAPEEIWTLASALQVPHSIQTELQEQAQSEGFEPPMPFSILDLESSTISLSVNSAGWPLDIHPNRSDRSRSCGIQFPKLALYQLSYTPKFGKEVRPRSSYFLAACFMLRTTKQELHDSRKKSASKKTTIDKIIFTGYHGCPEGGQLEFHINVNC